MKNIFKMILAVSLGVTNVANAQMHTRISPSGSFCQWGSYNQTPESPDETKLVYSKYTQVPTTDGWAYDGEVWLCSSNGTNHVKVADFRDKNPHNGAGTYWIDNTRIAANNIWNGTKFGAAVFDTSGAILYGPYRCAYVQHGPVNNTILIESPIWNPNNVTRDLAIGIWKLDISTGTLTQVVSQSSFLPFKDLMTGSDDPSDWSMTHPTWSTDGTKIAIRLSVAEGSKNNMFNFNADGTEIAYFGIKPTHFDFFDSKSIWGDDDMVNDGQTNNKFMRRWDLTGGFLETIAGAGNHNAISPNKMLLAAENWYSSNPVNLYLYKFGNTTAIATLMSHPYTAVTWDLDVHVNPSFSRNGKKLFYNQAVSSGMNEAWVVDISSYISTPDIDNTFNSEATGSNPAGWTESSTPNTDASIVEFPSASDKSIKLFDNNKAGKLSVHKTFPAESRQFITQFRFYTAGTDKWSKFLISSGTTRAVELYEVGGYLKYRNSSGVDVNICPISANTWHTIRILGNLTTDDFDIIVNGAIKGSALPFANAVISVDKVEIGTGKSSTNTLYISDVVMKTP